MKRALILSTVITALCVPQASAQTVTGTISDDGLIVLNGDIDLLGVDLFSSSGNLIPIIDSNPNPFDLLIRNTSTQVLLGSVGVENAVSLEGGLTLNVGYQKTDLFDLEGTWGGPAAGQQGAIDFAQSVPEPNGAILWLFALAALIGFRRRRNPLRW